jgi:hypothetical protein
METVDYIDLLQGCADLSGLDRDNLSTSEEAILRNTLSKRLRWAWQYAKWPELCLNEKRYYRPAYASGSAYTSGTEIYWPLTQFCYQALTATTGNPPTDASKVQDFARWAKCVTSRAGTENYDGLRAYLAGDQVYDPATDAYYQAVVASTGALLSDPTKWVRVNEFSRYVSRDQAGFETIGTVWADGVRDKDWQVTLEAQRAHWRATENGIQVISDLPFVWIEFRLPAPRLWGSKWSSTGAYLAGAQVYYSGNMYDALQTTSAGQSPDSAPSKWELVEIPLRFKQALEAGASGDYLATTDDTQSDRLRQLAEGFLADEAMVLLGQEGQLGAGEVLVLTR